MEFASRPPQSDVCSDRSSSRWHSRSPDGRRCTVKTRPPRRRLAQMIACLYPLPQAQAVSLLQKVRPQQPAPLFILTDPNKDPDDLSVLVETKYLEEHGFVQLRCVVATLGDRQVRTTRAKFARSVLDELGLKHTRVGVGRDYEFAVKDAQGLVDAKVTQGREKDHAVFVESPLLRPDANVELNGPEVLREELQQVADHTAVFVVNAGMPDLAELLRDAPELVRHKVARVVIMGGVESQLDQQGFAVADKRAYNNSTHQPSADYTYKRLQELGVPLVVVVREAAYTAARPAASMMVLLPQIIRSASSSSNSRSNRCSICGRGSGAVTCHPH
ncbi:MAG UNVERIFIED_CONTAM: hypothetical protein LVR18_50360 [Planctomycetaceae bacterium]